MLPFVAYFETLNITIIIAFVPAHVYSLKFGEKITFNIFLKNAYSAFFSIILLKHYSYRWKMRGYPQFSFWISIVPDMIYLSHIQL